MKERPARKVAAWRCGSFRRALLAASAQPPATDAERDARVQKFLDGKYSDWHDWNVPYEDGKVLHDLILRHQYTRALEIGTSRAIPPSDGLGAEQDRRQVDHHRNR
jgi:hypothetical protein